MIIDVAPVAGGSGITIQLALYLGTAVLGFALSQFRSTWKTTSATNTNTKEIAELKTLVGRVAALEEHNKLEAAEARGEAKALAKLDDSDVTRSRTAMRTQDYKTGHR